MAALVAALLLAGTAAAQEVEPPAPAAGPTINKITIYNASVPTVSYSVRGGSPHLQALVQALQYTENEINLTGQLQKLRLGIVVNEQTLDAVRTSQQMGLGPLSTPSYPACDSDLKRALIPGLAQEATPAMAFELINLREKVQTELRAEQEKSVVAARAGLPATQAAPPAAKPVATPQAVAPKRPVMMGTLSTPAAPERLPTPLEQQVLAFQQTVRQHIMQAQQLQALQLQRVGLPR
jgi:hypothetical protein